MTPLLIKEANRLLDQRNYLMKKIEQEIDHGQGYVVLSDLFIKQGEFMKQVTEKNKEISGLVERTIEDSYRVWLTEVEDSLKRLGVHLDEDPA